MAKITIIGSGDVGAMTGFLCSFKGLGNIVLNDIIEGLPQGRALDIQESLALNDSESRVTGTNGFDETADSDIVVITAGSPRKPGMTRDDLLAKNLPVVTSVAKKALEKSPAAIFIIVTNPVDIMAYATYKALGLTRARVIGMAGVLDSFRMRTFLAEAAGTDVKDADAMALGSHGDLMVPVLSTATVKGQPASSLLDKDALDEVARRTVSGGGEIVDLLKTRSTMYAPAAAITRMAEAILKDEQAPLPASAYLQGEYGIDGTYIGVPAVIGREGLMRIDEIELSEEENRSIRKAAEHLKELCKKADELLS